MKNVVKTWIGIRDKLGGCHKNTKSWRKQNEKADCYVSGLTQVIALAACGAAPTPTAIEAAPAGKVITVGFAQVGNPSSRKLRTLASPASLLTVRSMQTHSLAPTDTSKANWLAECLNGAEANILFIEGTIGSSAAIGCTDGFKSVAAQHPGWKILDSQSGDFTQTGGQEVLDGRAY